MSIGVVVDLAHLSAVEVISVMYTRNGLVGINRFHKALICSGVVASSVR